MGADASKAAVVDPRMISITASSGSFRGGKRNSSGGAYHHQSGGLVSRLLQGQHHLIDTTKLAQEACKAVCVKLDNDQELWVLPLHVAVALPGVPLQTVKDILKANPRAVYQHTTLTEEKLKRIISAPSDDVSVMERSVASYASHSSTLHTARNSVYSSEDSGWGAGWLPLHIAVWYGGSLDVLRYLLGKAPSSVYCKTSQGYLALHLACFRPTKPNEKHVSTLVEAFPASIYVSTSDNAMANDLLQENLHHKETEDPATSAIMDLLTGSNSVSRRYDPLPRCVQSIPSTRSVHNALIKSKRQGLINRFGRRKNTDSMNFKPTKLFVALTCADWKAAEERLQKRPHEAGYWTLSANDMDPPCHMLPLHVALRRRAPLSLTRRIIEAYPDGVYCREFYGMLPLHVACHAGCSVEMASLLYEKYPDAAHIADMSGMLPLHLACSSEGCRVPLVLYVLESYPAGMFVKDSRGFLASDYVEHSRHPHQKMLQAEFQRGEAFWSASHVEEGDLVYHIGKRNWPKVMECLENRRHGSAKEWTKHPNTGARYLPIHFCCKYKAPFHVIEAIVKEYPEGLSSPSQEFDMLPLHLACQHGCSPKIMEFMLEHCPDAASTKDAHGLLPLHLACTEGTSVPVVQALLRANPKASTVPDRRGMTPRVYAEASNYPHSKQVARLLTAGAH